MRRYAVPEISRVPLEELLLQVGSLGLGFVPLIISSTPPHPSNPLHPPSSTTALAPQTSLKPPHFS
jgi:HrpA-like RNA helicase